MTLTEQVAQLSQDDASKKVLRLLKAIVAAIDPVIEIEQPVDGPPEADADQEVE